MAEVVIVPRNFKLYFFTNLKSNKIWKNLKHFKKSKPNYAKYIFVSKCVVLFCFLG